MPLLIDLFVKCCVGGKASYENYFKLMEVISETGPGKAETPVNLVRLRPHNLLSLICKKNPPKQQKTKSFIFVILCQIIRLSFVILRNHVLCKSCSKNVLHSVCNVPKMIKAILDYVFNSTASSAASYYVTYIVEEHNRSILKATHV